MYTPDRNTFPASQVLHDIPVTMAGSVPLHKTGYLRNVNRLPDLRLSSVREQEWGLSRSI